MSSQHFTPQPHMVARSAPKTPHTLTQNHPPIGPYGAGSPSNTSTTPAQIFAANKWYQWWNGPLGYTFGQPDAYGGGTEQGTDFGTPLNTQIRSHVVGTVVYSKYTGDPSLGYVIQIKTPNGGVWHFQHMNTSAVGVGQQVQVGSLLGLSGGAAGASSGGPHIEVRYSPTFNAALAYGTGLGTPANPAPFWADGKWQNSLPIIQQTVGAQVSNQAIAPNNAIANAASNVTGFLGGIFSGLFGFAQTSNVTLPTSASYTLPKVQIAPTADVTNFLVAIDAFLEVVNPLDVPNVQQDTILGATFPDPISWITAVGYNLILDMSAVVWRVAFFAFGAYLCFKVANHFINFEALAGSAVKIAGSAALLA